MSGQSLAACHGKISTQTENEYSVSVNNLSKQYRSGNKTVHAVQSLTLNIKKGEIFGLLGPNGAGKTTTVLMLATLIRPTSGTIMVNGYDALREPQPVRRAIGIVNQETGVDPYQTARELLIRHGRLWKMNHAVAKQKASQMLIDFGLEEAADRPLKTYSGGMRRRLDLALALVHTPQVLYLDEPTTGLDPSSRRTVWKEIQRLKASGVTILLTTQYLEEADQLADRVAIMERGKIIATGTPSSLKQGFGGEIVTVHLQDSKQLEIAAQLLNDAEINNGALRLKVPDGASEIPMLMALLLEQKIEVRSMTVARPTLEDVYLSITGPKENTTSSFSLLEGSEADA